MLYIVEVKLEDKSKPTLKKIQYNIAELTRHEQATKVKIHKKTKKPQGHKAKSENAPQPAKYHDWLTPLCWMHIVAVAKQVGWKMSTSAIAKGLKQCDETTFGNINHTTVDGWID